MIWAANNSLHKAIYQCIIIVACVVFSLTCIVLFMNFWELGPVHADINI